MSLTKANMIQNRTRIAYTLKSLCRMRNHHFDLPWFIAFIFPLVQDCLALGK